jgi:hypothetical protein
LTRAIAANVAAGATDSAPHRASAATAKTPSSKGARRRSGRRCRALGAANERLRPAARQKQVKLPTPAGARKEEAGLDARGTGLERVDVHLEPFLLVGPVQPFLLVGPVQRGEWSAGPRTVDIAAAVRGLAKWVSGYWRYDSLWSGRGQPRVASSASKTTGTHSRKPFRRIRSTGQCASRFGTSSTGPGAPRTLRLAAMKEIAWRFFPPRPARQRVAPRSHRRAKDGDARLHATLPIPHRYAQSRSNRPHLTFMVRGSTVRVRQRDRNICKSHIFVV